MCISQELEELVLLIHMILFIILFPGTFTYWVRKPLIIYLQEAVTPISVLTFI